MSIILNKDAEAPYLIIVVFIEIVNVSKCIAHDEDLENLLLSLQDCVERIDRNQFPGNFNFLEHFLTVLRGIFE